MKAIKLLFVFLILLSVICCVNQKQKDEDQIKQTVKNYWKAIKNKDLKSYEQLMDDSEKDEFDAVNSYDLEFLNRNYLKLNCCVGNLTTKQIYKLN